MDPAPTHSPGNASPQGPPPASADLLRTPAAPADAPVEEIPAFADGSFQKLHPNALTLDRIGWLVFAAIIFLASLVPFAITFFADGPGEMLPWLIFGGGLLLAAVVAVLGTRLSRRSYEATRYAVSPLGLEIRRGIWWRHMIDVPRSRIQHTDVQQGPLARQMGVGKLIVYTAGTQHASVELDGLPHDRALVLRDFLLRGGEHDDAV